MPVVRLGEVKPFGVCLPIDCILAYREYYMPLAFVHSHNLGKI